MFGGGSLRVRAKQIATVQDLTPLIVPSTHPMSRVITYRMMIRRAVRRADRVIVPSHGDRPRFDRRVTGAPRAHRAHSAGYQSADEAHRPDLRVCRALSDKPGPSFSRSGFWNRARIRRFLLDVLRELSKAGHDLELIIIGRPGWRWIDPLSTEKYRDMRPWVRILADIPDPDLIEFYNRAELFMYPSFYEGFGLPILEAMACGAPVISSAVSSMPEVAGAAALFADPQRSRAVRRAGVATIARSRLASSDGRGGHRTCADGSVGESTAEATLRGLRGGRSRSASTP